MSKKYAFIFPGQGSQHLGMLAELAKHYYLIKDLYDLASKALGYDLWELTQHGPIEQLNETERTQPALLVAGVASWQIWQSMMKTEPQYFAGHSLGEYTALVCAGVFDIETGIDLVAARGHYMQEAVPVGKGAMAAIVGLDQEIVKGICDEACEYPEQVSPANYNTVGQIVIAGESEAVERAMTFAKEQGAKIVMKLPMSVPSHCNLMKPAAERLAQKLAGISLKEPRIPVINNVDVCVYQQPEQIVDALVRQLYSPVRWIETIQYLINKDINVIIESGPGKVLTGLNKRIASDLALAAITNPDTLQDAVNLVQNHQTEISTYGS